MIPDLHVLRVSGYNALQDVYAREGTREEIQAALAALGEPVKPSDMDVVHVEDLPPHDPDHCKSRLGGPTRKILLPPNRGQKDYTSKAFMREWLARDGGAVGPKLARDIAVAPKFMALTVADAADTLRELHEYNATGDGRKVSAEIRRGERWLAACGWSYRIESRELRCLTCRRTYAPSKANSDHCSRAA